MIQEKRLPTSAETEPHSNTTMPSPLHWLLSQLVRADNSPEMSIPRFGLSEAAWTHIHASAPDHGVVALLYYLCKQQGKLALLPPAVKQSWATTYFAEFARNELYYQEIERLLETFPSLREALFLKGAVLAATAYPHVGLRPVGDLDLLVPERDIEALYKQFVAAGFTAETSLQRLNWLRRTVYEVNFGGGEDLPMHVELHWQLAGEAGGIFRPDIDWFWQRTTSAEIENIDARVLQPTANLLYLCAHAGLKHSIADTRLIWLHDIHLVIGQQEIDWSTFLEGARAFHWSLAAHRVLTMVQALFATPISAEVLRQLADQVTDVERTYVRQSARQTGRLTKAKGYFLTTSSWRTRGQLLLGFLFPSQAYLCWRYGDETGQSKLAYPRFWVDALREAVRMVAK